jgi:hypothetical protein
MEIPSLPVKGDGGKDFQSSSTSQMESDCMTSGVIGALATTCPTVSSEKILTKVRTKGKGKGHGSGTGPRDEACLFVEFRKNVENATSW